MFDHAFEYVCHGFGKSNYLGVETLCGKYAFTSTKNHQRYIVEVDHFEDNELFAVKFYQKNHEGSKNKYHLLTKSEYSITVFSTVLSIMSEIYSKYPYCSFVFQGAKLLTEDNESDTKRFRLYGKICKYFFSPSLFEHFDRKTTSHYVVLNRAYRDKQSLLDLIATLSDPRHF